MYGILDVDNLILIICSSFPEYFSIPLRAFLILKFRGGAYISSVVLLPQPHDYADKLLSPAFKKSRQFDDDFILTFVSRSSY